MNLFALLPLQIAGFAAPDAGLSWNLAVKSTRAPGSTAKKGRYILAGKGFKGEVAWFLAKKGTYDVKKLVLSDTQRTKEADATKGFMHTEMAAPFAGIEAIRSEQQYTWDGFSVMSTCVYATVKQRAWVIRLWWSPDLKAAPLEARAFLASFKRLP